MLIFSLLVGKILLFLLRLAGRGGSALPGLVIEKLYPSFLPKMLNQLSGGVVLITGTNGKTTTTKILSELLEANGLRVLTNKTGSNFVRGTISAIAEAADMNGKLTYDIAVFEQDEAHAVRFVDEVKPSGVVALNIMRDQMDRFGEIDTTAKLVSQVAEAAKDWVVLNANDSRIAAIALKIGVSTLWFGHSEALVNRFVTDDQHHHQDDLTYFAAAEPNVCLTALAPSKITVKIGEKSEELTLRLDGTHNALNVTAALTALAAIMPDAPFEKTRGRLETIEPAFGRGERIKLNNGAELRLQLVKNPSGFTHGLGLLNDKKYDAVGVVINDDYADGRDVSWLWDVDFVNINKHKTTVICGGSRGYDMAVRLKYEGVFTDSVSTELSEFLESVVAKADQNAIIYCTYTAMLALRKLLSAHSPDVKRSIL